MTDKQCSSCGGFCKKSGCERENVPPQREWVGLTDEEIKECFVITPDLYLPLHIYQKIEAKLKDKNI